MTFNPTSWSAPVPDLVKEYNTWDYEQHSPEPTQDKPEEFSKSLVRRGLLDPETGLSLENSKQGCIQKDNVQGYSLRGQEEYKRIFGHD